MTWYRSHRPKTIAGLHLAQVRATFHELMSQGRMPQVLLFAGPKGTGKTSTARILGAMLNDPANEAAVRQVFFAKPATSTPTKPIAFQEPQPTELATKIFNGTSYLVQEMDAASNRGIDDVRALKERVNLPPQEGVMSVYILDEAHMLTTEAFNALLKLLEEPPPHAVFILATTELHKIPVTIVSRCTMIQFTKATVVELNQALSQVLTAEKIEFDPAAVELVAEYADGSFRDGVKALELVAAGEKKLTVERVTQLLTGSYRQHLERLLDLLLAKDAPGLAQLFQELRLTNLDPEFFFKQLCALVHTNLLQGLGVTEGQPRLKQTVAHFLLSELQAISLTNTTSIPFLPLEMKLMELIFRSKTKPSPAPASGPTSEQKKQPSSSSAAVKASAMVVPPIDDAVHLALVSQDPPETVGQASPVTSPEVTEAPFADAAVMVSDNLQPVSTGDGAKLLAQWERFVDLVRDKNSSVAALLRSAKPLASDQGKATIAVFYKFHKEQLQQPKFRKMIEECSEPVTGGPITFEFVLADAAPTNTTGDSANQDVSSLAEELLM